MTRRILQVALVIGVLMATSQVVHAAGGDPFSSRREAVARQQEPRQYVLRPWGGPTTSTNWWTREYVSPRNHHHGSGGNTYNIYYFAPFSYPYINYGWGY